MNVILYFVELTWLVVGFWSPRPGMEPRNLCMRFGSITAEFRHVSLRTSWLTVSVIKQPKLRNPKSPRCSKIQLFEASVFKMVVLPHY